MGEYEKKQNEYFSERYKKYGYSHRTLSWESPFTQNARFVELLKVCTMGKTFNKLSILDYGCGLGHLYKFIQENGLLAKWDMAYTGIDINTDLIEMAKKQHPKARFEVNDGSVFKEKFDYVLCSGIYNLKFSDEYDIGAHYTEEISRLYGIASQGVAVNFQTINALPMIPERLREGEKKRFYFHDPGTILSNLRAVTDKISTSTGYLPGDYDVTVYLMK